MQLELLSERSTADPFAALEGLLIGPAHMVRRGDQARLSVVIPDQAGPVQWRVDALLSAFADAGFSGESARTPRGQTVVRSEFTPLLVPLATAWTRGAVKAPPADFTFDAAKLRLWAVASGHTVMHAVYQFHLDDRADTQVVRALRPLSVQVTAVGPRAGGPALRVSGQRRLRHLAALMGPAPAGADWPDHSLDSSRRQSASNGALRLTKGPAGTTPD
ncbi:MAG: hypothetical protein HOQ05_08515 [Corynebacteriales bacterium]|nr:hypothetical protein [Mycobacteriales bacterium]